MKKFYTNPPITLYWCFFYFTQFTFIGDYFDYWVMPSSYLVVLLGVIILYLTVKVKNLNRYLFLALLPLSFDIILNLEIINYWLFAVKYVCLFIITSNTYLGKIDPFSKGTKYIYNFYLISFVISLPFLFGFDILPNLDATILRKNIEGNGYQELYTVTTFFSGYLSGEFAIPIFNIPLYRFTSFHIEPSNFTLYFVPLTILCWKNLSLFKKILAGLMIFLSFSVTSFIILPILVIIKLVLFNKNINNFSISILIITLLIVGLNSSNVADSSVGKLINYKIFESSSADNTLSQLNYFDISNLFIKNSFNKLPAGTEIKGLNPLSIIFWAIYLTSIILYSIRQKKTNGLALAYFLIHGLKGATHIYPGFFLIYLIFINNKDKYIQSPSRQLIQN